MTRILWNGPETATPHLILAHGAGAGMTSPFLEAMAGLLSEKGLRVARFEFAYMAARRTGGTKRPPPRAETLIPEYAEVVDAVSETLAKNARLYIGGKSLGGRVASLVAESAFSAGQISGLVCLGYPSHPPGRPERLRTAHLVDMPCPTLIVQGTRDPFGSRAKVDAIPLSPQCRIHWIGDGDHDFVPRRASGFSRDGNLEEAANAVAAFTGAGLKRR